MHRRAESTVIAVMIFVLTVVLAGFALGVLQQRPQQLEGELNARGTSVSGLYNPTDDSFEGPAHVVFASGEVYDGGLEGQRFSGFGVIRGEEHDEQGNAFPWSLEGTFRDGRLAGTGSYSDNLGNYEGSFSNSLPNGKGIYTSASGWRYEGEFQAGKMTGKGTVFFPDGTSSTGEFEDGLQVTAD